MVDFSKLKWKKGMPPSVGWWLCDKGLWWRYFDGNRFSVGCKPTAKPKIVTKAASKYAVWHYEPIWCDYWPENAVTTRT